MSKRKCPRCNKSYLIFDPIKDTLICANCGWGKINWRGPIIHLKDK